jgi:hypothetical protein
MRISSFFCIFFCSYTYFYKPRRRKKNAKAPYIYLYIYFFLCCCLKMYSIRRDPNNSYYYWTMNYQQQQHFIFNNRQMIKTKQDIYWSTKFYNNKDSSIQHYSLNNKSTDSSNSHDISLPVYRAPCTFQNPLITTSKGKNYFIII